MHEAHPRRIARKVAWAMALMLAPSLAGADAGLSVDARYDLTGDGIVDASDWKKMDEQTKAAYARDVVVNLGENPDVIVDGELSRAQRYLQGLKSVYE